MLGTMLGLWWEWCLPNDDIKLQGTADSVAEYWSAVSYPNPQHLLEPLRRCSHYDENGSDGHVHGDIT